MQPFIDNRMRLFDAMHDNSVALFSSAHFAMRSNDTEYAFRQESNFYYFTGFEEDSAVLVCIKQAKQTKSVLFVQPKDATKELWSGVRLGVDKALDTLGCDEVYDIEQFDTVMPALLEQLEYLYIDTHSSYFTRMQNLINKAARSKEHFARIGVIIDTASIVVPLRRVKQAWELARIKEALAITKRAHHAAMAMTNSSLKEFQVAAMMEYVFSFHGANSAYGTIVASGNNANTLHYVSNAMQFKSGDMVLIDAGAEYLNYASDITRTFAVDGAFTAAQKELYTIVLEAQNEAIGALKIGTTKNEINTKALKVLIQGLKDLNIIDADIDTAIEHKLYMPYYPHSIGHFMGLDVHDPLFYKNTDGSDVTLVCDDVLTIEPGLYLPANDLNVPERFRGMGVRIEDDFHITQKGAINLSSDIAKTIDEVQAMCKLSVYDFI